MSITRRTCLALATLLTLSGVWASPPPGASSPSPSEDLSAPTLSRQLELDITELLNVLEADEGATHARYRLVTRLSAGAVARRVGEALPAPWQPQPSPPNTTPSRPLGGFGAFSGYQLRYLNETAAQLLSVRVQPLGRSNLFRLELRLTSLTEQP